MLSQQPDVISMLPLVRAGQNGREEGAGTEPDSL